MCRCFFEEQAWIIDQTTKCSLTVEFPSREQHWFYNLPPYWGYMVPQSFTVVVHSFVCFKTCVKMSDLWIGWREWAKTDSACVVGKCFCKNEIITEDSSHCPKWHVHSSVTQARGQWFSKLSQYSHWKSNGLDYYKHLLPTLLHCYIISN